MDYWMNQSKNFSLLDIKVKANHNRFAFVVNRKKRIIV